MRVEMFDASLEATSGSVIEKHERMSRRAVRSHWSAARRCEHGEQLHVPVSGAEQFIASGR